VDLYHPTLALFQKASQPLTINGAHLNEEGNRLLAEIIAGALLKKEVKANLTLNPLRKAVLDKNWHWFNRYRATDGNDIWGGVRNFGLWMISQTPKFYSMSLSC
jgi:hypothetical protein